MLPHRFLLPGKKDLVSNFQVVKKFAATALLVLFVLIGQGSAENAVPLPEYYSKKNLSGFFSRLVAKKEYYRAAHELRRLYSYYPDTFSLQSFVITEEFLLFRGGQFKAVPAVHLNYGVKPAPASWIFHVDSYLMGGDYKKAEEGILKWSITEDKELNVFFSKRKLYLSVMKGASGEEEEFFKLKKAGSLDDYPKLKRDGTALFGSMKSPFLGAALGLVPGMGYIYGGETGTGIVSFIAISICASLSWLGFRYNTPSAGIFLGAVATFFYTGSVIGGYRLADRHNGLVRRRISLLTTKELEMYRDQQRIYNRFGAGKYE